MTRPDPMASQLLQINQFFAAPPARVFAYFADHDNFGRLWWPAHCRRLRTNPQGEASGIGSVREIRLMGVRFEETITALEPDAYIEYRVTRGGPFRHHIGRMRFVAVPEGTELDYTIAFDCPWPLLGNFVSGILHATWLRGVNRAMERIIGASP